MEGVRSQHQGHRRQSRTIDCEQMEESVHRTASSGRRVHRHSRPKDKRQSIKTKAAVRATSYPFSINSRNQDEGHWQNGSQNESGALQPPASAAEVRNRVKGARTFPLQARNRRASGIEKDFPPHPLEQGLLPGRGTSLDSQETGGYELQAQIRGLPSASGHRVPQLPSEGVRQHQETMLV